MIQIVPPTTYQTVYPKSAIRSLDVTYITQADDTEHVTIRASVVGLDQMVIIHQSDQSKNAADIRAEAKTVIEAIDWIYTGESHNGVTVPYWSYGNVDYTVDEDGDDS